MVLSFYTYLLPLLLFSYYVMYTLGKLQFRVERKIYFKEKEESRIIGRSFPFKGFCLFAGVFATPGPPSVCSFTN